MSQQLLIIAYYWPPAGGPGVQRWLGFTKHLPALGYEVTVVVPKDAHYPVLDLSLLEALPQGIQVIQVPIKEPSRVASLLSRKRTNQLQKGIINKRPSSLQNVLLWLRGNLFIPDARVGWKPAVLRALQAYCTENKNFTLITTGPPHSVHLIGAALKKAHKSIKWLADFRDPWTTIGYHKELKLSAFARKKHEQLEHNILTTADALIVTSPQTATEFATKTTRPIHTITNGYDIAVNTSDAQPAGAFTLAHVGTLLANRNPQVLWRVLSKLVKKEPHFATDFKLILAGNIGDEIRQAIAQNGLSDFTINKGYVSHKQATAIMFTSQLLLLIEINSEDTKAIIAGKIFEYLASGRPIVAIGPQDAAIASIIERNNAGAFFNYEDEIALYNHIQSRYHDYKNGLNTANTSTTIAQYERKVLTNSLAALIQTAWES